MKAADVADHGIESASASARGLQPQTPPTGRPRAQVLPYGCRHNAQKDMHFQEAATVRSQPGIITGRPAGSCAINLPPDSVRCSGSEPQAWELSSWIAEDWIAEGEIEVSMRPAVAASVLLALLIITGPARAADCPGHPNALGVSRTIVLDPAEHPLLGTLQYNESLPLNDHEVVLTFDDGPLPPYTTRVLDTLASECVKATFFLVGRMALGYPPLVQREYNEGHTIAGHSQNHPFTFAKMSVEQAAKEIEDGFASLRSVLGDPRTVAPFFRIPGLLRQDSVESYLASHHYATWSLDFLADDWTHISAREIVRRSLQRIEARHRGILLLHDIQPATALALPTLLAELKARGYKIVHVVPATPDRPATVAQTDEWMQRHPLKPSWPRVLASAPSTGQPGVSTGQPGLDVPSPASFGVADSTGELMTSDPAAQRGKAAADRMLLQNTPWPNVKFTEPAETDLLPVPDAQDFIYYSNKSKLSLGAVPDRKSVRQKLAATPKLALRPASSRPASPPRESGSAATRTKPVGHQLTVPKPTASLSDLLKLGQR